MMIHLTGHNYNARETIQNIFSPLVGVITSSLADDVCYKNNLSFVELLQPFTKLPNDAHFRDVSGTSVSIRGLRLNVCDVNWRPPQTVLARKMLNEAVTNAHNDKTKFVSLGSLDVEIPTSEPWFEHWRESFLTVQFPADHEFTRHFLSCLIVLSSADPSIVDTAHKLTQRAQQMQNVTPQKLPKWFHPNDVLNSYVVLHEGGAKGDLSKAQQSYELLKSTFGDNKCFLIQINSLDGSGTSEVPDYWATYLKRHPKIDAQSEQFSASKTPQDSVSAISMPTMQMSALAEAAAEIEQSIVHPLSPIQEHATEAINSKFSTSSESIASQNINPNVWGTDLDNDAPRGCSLNSMDVENLRHFIQDYAVRALIPYIEHLVALLSEAITNKKGVSKSLFSATKRWFVTSKPGASTSNQNAVIYTSESSELQTRKLGDLYFMFGHYSLAFQAYHQAKRDFNADSAWQYYAGALEMAAVSAFMLGTANRKTYDYMEDAIVCYLTVCKLQQFATRATLLSMECLKTARLYGEAAKQLVRMTTEESDLRSALLLEQAAYCFLSSNPMMYRKYAFHIVLSGNRYSRVGQRKHAYRCYKQAYQVFQDRGWSLAEDHIQYTMGKQAYILKKLEEASRSQAHLLRPGSLQNALQQTNFLKEYIQTQNEFIKRSPNYGLLPHAVPQVLQDSIRVLTSAYLPATNSNFEAANNIDIKSDLSDESIWHKLEEMAFNTAFLNKPLVFKPTRYLFTKDCPTTEPPLAVQGEPIELAVTLTNAVKCSISMTEIDLLWKLKLDNDEQLSNECLYESPNESSNKTAVTAALKTSCSQSLTLEERAEKTLFFKLTPKLHGQLNIIGIVCQVANTSESNVKLMGSLQFETQRIKAIGKQTNQTLYDSKLSIKILPPQPSLHVSFLSLPKDIIVGEVLPVQISLRNLGITPITDVFVGCDNPRWLTLMDKNEDIPLSILRSVRDLSNEKLVKDKEIRRQHVFRMLKPTDGVALKAQESTIIPMRIQAPFEKGEFTLRLLFYYGLSTSTTGGMKYRIVRHTWKFNVHECLRTDIACVVANNVSGELGLNVNVKNENEMHHPVMAEVYIDSLALYCENFMLNPEKFYVTNNLELSVGQLGDHCLKSSKSASFQCRLLKSCVNGQEDKSFSELLKSRFSEINVMPVKNYKEGNHLPLLYDTNSFLVKQETVFFNSNISTEDFNALTTRQDSHSTVAINWTASIVHNSQQRIAHGTHFVTLRYLHEYESCPSLSQIPYRKQEHTTRLIDFYNQFKPENEIEIAEIDEDYWEENDNFVGSRCLLEDENFLLTVKA
ncbi:trafficking protein particle complex subunit 8 [Teleopsis dalmanni]|uniref:trafficking protein particle complex subunit 8 n=1 Tax=Teleopsis dalmanni TaxID=139649 RepID=UPI0018CE9035|nr:trafficking protein particle complex subunit 8 [Teleopsis dalmanni]